MEIMKKDGFLNQRYIAFPISRNLEDADHPLIHQCYPTELGYFPQAHYHYRERKEGSPDHILLYCSSGKGFVEVNNQHYRLTANQAIWIENNTAHLYYADDSDPWTLLWFHFHTSEGAFFPNKNQPTESFSLAKAQIIEKHFSELFNLCEKSYLFQNTVCISKLMRLLLADIFYLQESVESDHQNMLLNQALRFMQAHLKEELTIDSIAEHLDISESYVSLIFNKYQKKGPIDALIDMRIEQACKLLRISNLKIYEIAQEVGYKDPYYFSRIFKKKIGSSPKKYRHQLA